MGFLDKLLKKISKNTLYYPGCLSKFVLKNISENYKEILTKIGIDYIILRDLEVCCGSPLLNAGYRMDFNKIKEKNVKIFEEHGISKIITSCPACYKIFSQNYEWDIEVEHITKTVLNNLKKLKLKKCSEVITYHDPCHLGRHSNIYEEPRKIIEEMGYHIKEMYHYRESALCCGGGAGLRANFPEYANKIAKMRMQEAMEIGVEKLITACPLCFQHLKENADIKVLELSELLISAIK